MWKIIDQFNNRFLELKEHIVLDIGNIEGMDIHIPNKNDKNFVFQLIVENDFIFYCFDKNVKTYFDNFSINIQGKFIEAIYLENHKDFFEMVISDEEIRSIYLSHEFQTTLSLTQEKLSELKMKSFLELSIKREDVINQAIFVLNSLFWEKRCLFDSNERDVYKKILWLVWAHICEYGILTGLLINKDISEVMVNGCQQIYYEKQGQIILSSLKFFDIKEIYSIIERICSAVGRRIDESMPYCDARLKDGSRVHAILPPLALDGPYLTIRKFPKQNITPEKLIEYGSISKEKLEFLKKIVQQKRNILISGGTGSGKTTLLNCLSSFVPTYERVITIEDSAELSLLQPHVVRLESRAENSEKKGQVNLRDLVKNSLRMRPDRIIVGECRGGEALDMLQAMNTGHDGSMTTIHANTPIDALRRLETLVLFAMLDLPSRAIREQIASSVHYVIQQARLSSGKRCVTHISKVVGICDATNKFILEDVF